MCEEMTIYWAAGAAKEAILSKKAPVSHLGPDACWLHLYSPAALAEW